ncbi:MAG TPA: response regulator transcription factor [Ignavibacteriaceae bacterium]|nr:response regulator transcription factor [Ignavibacteriaceae bacterium]
MQNNIIKILIADDHNLFRAGIIKLFNEHPEIKVIGEVTNGLELIDKYFELSPDLLLVDIAMPGMTGLEAVSKIKEEDPSVKALFLSMYEGDEYIYKAFKCGGLGLINKSILESELIYAIETVSNGKKYFLGNPDEESFEKIVKEFESGKKVLLNLEENLNYRERQVLDLLRQGLTSQEMADKLNLSRRTIDFYRSCLMQKFNLKSAADLSRFSFEYYQDKESNKN